VHELPILTAEAVDAAAEVLRRGGLLGFPTETVYGLAADAENEAAVDRIFAAKGRPRNHPLIVHLADASALNEWAVEIPAYAWELAAKFWPGPLTLILHRSPRAKDFVTGGHPTVGLRVPSNPVGLSVLRKAGLAVAAPSANRFGSVSPTTAKHVVVGLSEFLDPSRDAVIDGGAASVGVESTIVDCTQAEPRILRPGAISAAEIAEVTGLDVRAADGAVAAPGTLAAHYAPRARVHLVRADQLPEQESAGVIALSEVDTPAKTLRLAAPRDAFEYARDLYEALHRADDLGLTDIYAVLPDGTGIEVAIADRLEKAAVGSGGTV
jgi:L-threonylcarbamoyladenylate synthase